jgi:hypothetical protein
MVAISLFGSRITWRGIVYRLLPGGKIETISREEPGVLRLFRGDDEPADESAKLDAA